MTAPTPSASESVSNFAWFWLSVAATIALVAGLLITYKMPVLAFLKPYWPYIDFI